jgi:lysophospholipase L1-like esterase
VVVPDYPEGTMADLDEQRRPRRAWPWVALVVALALVVPVVMSLDDEPGGAAADQQRLTSSEPTAPTGAATAPSTPASTSPSAAPVAKGKPRALFFGDSYFIGGGYTDESNSMARIASNRLGWVSEINGGGGTGFVQGNPEYGIPSFLGQIADGAFDVGRRDWVVIEGGNDDRFLDQKAVGKNVRKVLRIAQRRFPDATVVLVGPMDTDGDLADTTPVAKTMRKAARKRGVPFVDARRWLDGNYDQIGPDFTHPYPKGHRICATRLTKALRRLGA